MGEDMRAVLICDCILENITIRHDLLHILKSKGITEIYRYSSLEEFKMNYDAMTYSNEPCLYFPNSYVRYKNIDDIIKAHEVKPTLDYLKISHHIVSFLPLRMKVARESIAVKDGTKPFTYYDFKDTNLITYIKPTLPSTRIFLTTHHRDTYLKLTLSSLLWSLADSPEIPITLLLNEPTSKVLEVSNEFMNKYPQIDALNIKNTAGFAAINVGIQWYKPEVTIIAEDDFILPSTTRFMYPIWVYQFWEKLKECDLVGWPISLDNINFNILPDWEEEHFKNTLGWFYNNPQLMYQLTAFKTEFWLKHIDQKTFFTNDQALVKNSRKTACPMLKGYHIGYNQWQDGLYIGYGGGHNTPERVVVENLRTKETRTIALRDINQGP